MATSTALGVLIFSLLLFGRLSLLVKCTRLDLDLQSADGRVERVVEAAHVLDLPHHADLEAVVGGVVPQNVPHLI